MHPKVKEFWEKQGFEIVMWQGAGKGYNGPHRIIFAISNNEITGLWAGLSYEKDGYLEDLNDVKCEFYYIDGIRYSEEEILRVINLKCFL